MSIKIDTCEEHTFSLQPMNDELEQEWDRLALRCEAAPYLRPGWFRAWMNAFRPKQTLSLLTVRRREDVVAAVPLIATRFGACFPVNSETPSFGLLSVDEAAVRALASALLGRFRHLGLRFVSAGPQEEALVAAVRESGCQVVREVLRRSPYTRIDQSWEALREEVLGSSRRKAIKRRRRQLAELGNLQFEVHDATSSVRDLLAEGLALEAAGWKGAHKTAILSRKSTTRFYSQIADWAIDRGLLRLHSLRLDGRLIAFELALEQSGVIHVLKTAYDENLRRYGPGILILDDGLGYASRNPQLYISESLGEDDPYKVEFSTGAHEQLTISIFPNSLLGMADHVWHYATGYARNQARRRLPESARLRLARLAA